MVFFFFHIRICNKNYLLAERHRLHVVCMFGLMQNKNIKVNRFNWDTFFFRNSDGKVQVHTKHHHQALVCIVARFSC